jgi:hypothetical protein
MRPGVGIVSLLLAAGCSVRPLAGTPVRPAPAGAPGISGAAVEPKSIEAGQQAVVRYVLGRAGDVAIDLVDEEGRVVRELAGGRQAPGPHALLWDGRDAQGRVSEQADDLRQGKYRLVEPRGRKHDKARHGSGLRG